MIGWFRSYHGAPSHRKWGLIAKRASVPRSLVAALAWDLLDRGSQAADRGSVAGYDIDSFAFDMDCEPADVLRIMEAMRGADFLAGDRLSGWERRQVKREDTGASERQKDRRAAEKTARKAAEHDQLAVGDLLSEAKLDNPSSAVTHCHALSRTVTPEEIRAEEIREEAGRPAYAQAREPAASPPSMTDQEFETECRHVVTRWDPPKGSFRVMLALEGDREAILSVMREVVASRTKPVGTWKLWAEDVIPERLALRRAGPRIAAPGTPVPDLVFIAKGTDEWEAWRRWGLKNGQPNGYPALVQVEGQYGWRFKSRWPPDHTDNVVPLERVA